MTKLLPPKLFYCQNALFPSEKYNELEMKSVFEKAVAEVNTINVKPDNEVSLRLFSLFKQATKGDISIKQPRNPFDVIEKAQFDAWSSLKGKSTRDAQIEFISLVYKLKN